MIEGHPGEEFIFISDNGGEYNVFGLNIKSSEVWDFDILNFKNLDSKKVKTRYCEVFDIKYEHIAEPYLFIFSHFA
jgi:hypothetical protein